MLYNNGKIQQSDSDIYALNSDNNGGDFYGLTSANRRNQQNLPEPKSGGINLNKFRRSEPSKSSSGASSRSPTSSSSASSSSSSSTLATDKLNALKTNDTVQIFSMDKFKQALEYEARQAVPNRTRLQSMCVSIISFVCNDQTMLNLPSWIMIINMVAMDLLSSEIGLVGPYDIGTSDAFDSGYQLNSMQHPRFHQSRSSPNKLFRQFSRGSDYNLNDYDKCDFETNDGSEHYRKFNGLSSKNKLRLNNSCNRLMLLNEHQPVAKSANDQLTNSGQYFSGRQALVNLANSDGQLKLIASAESTASKDFANDVGSSSSGFTSNYSIQNDSSTTSSNSNLKSAVVTKQQPTSKKPINGIKRLFKGSDTSVKNKRDQDDIFTSSNRTQGSFESAPKSNPRGKRPPKLPHGLGSHGDNLEEINSQTDAVIMSKPIPIPAPPTSAGGPSGKANLILVSPTGLSPPTVKRNSKNLSVNPMTNQDRCPLPENFDTIKHIDEQGRCKVLLDNSENLPKRPPRLPTGIPAHAQLAPPATRRHILRYLMSTTRANERNLDEDNHLISKQSTALPPVPPGRRVQRPLPVLPCHQRQRQLSNLTRSNIQSRIRSSEESLYYSGLQARVPSYNHPQPLRGPIQQAYPMAKGAYDAILREFKQQQLSQLRHQHFMMASLLPHSTSQQILGPDPMNSDISFHPSKSTSASGQLDKDYQTSFNHRSYDKTRAYMRSLDSLNCHSMKMGSTTFTGNKASNNVTNGKPLVSLLSHVGGFLKRSRTKNSITNQDAK